MASESCKKCGRSRPSYIADPTCAAGGYCDWGGEGSWCGDVYVSKTPLAALRNGERIPEPQSHYELEAIASQVVDLPTGRESISTSPHLVVTWRPVRKR